VPLAGGEVEPASPAYARSGRTASSRRRAIGSSITRSSARLGLGSTIRYGAKRRTRARQARADEDALLAVGALVDGAPSAYSSRAAPSVVRDQQPHGSKRSREALAIRARSASSPSPSAPRPAARREAVREAPPPQRVDGVDLVQDELDGSSPRRSRRAPLARPRAARRARPRARGVDDVQDEVGDERLLERRREALDQLVRQAADEADRVGHEVAAPVELEAARRRVERLEQAVVDGDAAPVSAFSSVDLPTFV
jgi:hypothetical protein